MIKLTNPPSDIIGTVLVRIGDNPKAGRRCIPVELDSHGYFRVFYPETKKREATWGRYSTSTLANSFRIAKQQRKIKVPVKAEPKPRVFRYRNINHRRRELCLTLFVGGEVALTKRYQL